MTKFRVDTTKLYLSILVGAADGFELSLAATGGMGSPRSTLSEPSLTQLVARTLDTHL